MQDQPEARTRPVSRPSRGEEVDGPPRPSGRARFSAVFFTVLLVATLVAPVALDTAALPGLALVNLGLLLLLGFADLIDGSSRGFLPAVRLGGIVIALLGLVIQVL